MKKFLLLGLLLPLGFAPLRAERIPVSKMKYLGPFPVAVPAMIDTTDVNAAPFSVASLLNSAIDTRRDGPATVDLPATPPSHDASPAVHLLSFNIDNARHAKVTPEVNGITDYQLAVDGASVAPGTQLSLIPGSHRVTITYLSRPDAESDTLDVAVCTDTPDVVTVNTSSTRRISLDDILELPQYYGLELSPDGRHYIISSWRYRPGGQTDVSRRVVSLTDGHSSNLSAASQATWMPRSNRYIYDAHTHDGRTLFSVDPVTGNEIILASGLPEGYYVMTPDEQSLIFAVSNPGPKEDPDIYQILEPEDRQPGWRDRNSLAIYDLATSAFRPLTFGHANISLLDVAPDASRVLAMVSRSRLEKRPTTLFSVISIDVNTLDVDTIVDADGFITGAQFAPDGRRVLVSGSPEALGGIGKNVPEGRIPSMIDTQLYVIDLDSREITPLTRDFNPSVANYQWSKADGDIYFTAEDRDRVALFRIKGSAPYTITPIPVPEDAVNGFTLASAAPGVAMFYGQSIDNPQRLYSLNLRNLRSSLVEEPWNLDAHGIELGESGEWDFVSSRGDTINGRYYLPPSFDPSKRYPLIVNYYGGCSPTSRSFSSRYPHQLYSAMGYVVYVLNPSGATGFGQEFSSRHVNTAGQGVADDIIEGVQEFCRQHPYVDPSRIGCIGASYGGFMTQYLQTVTDLFAAAISHAGISDHTSYWGEGYWGYSYSEVSMADSYPWSDPDLYVKQSPLFRADKVNTPILFLHGDSDVNVPYGESIQMFTALKLLGKPTALVAVTDQDHHILQYDKVKKWQNTIFAWFARYLQDDPSWWDAIYTPKTL